jgi:hypothetical protein
MKKTEERWAWMMMSIPPAMMKRKNESYDNCEYFELYYFYNKI